MNKYIIITILILIAIVGGAFYFSSTDKQDYEYVEVVRGDIVEEVGVTGRVKASEEVELAFENGGRINKFYVEVGDKVEAGDKLSSVSGADLLTRISQQKAALQTQEAKLDELKAGTRQEEIDLQKIKVANTESSLNDSKASLVNSIKDSYVKSDDAIRNKVDQFISGPATANPQITFTVSNLSLENAVESGRKGVEGILNSWKISVDALNVPSDLVLKTNEAKNNLDSIALFLDNVALVINSSTVGLSGNTWKADVSSARTSVANASTALLTAESASNTALSNLAIANSELALKEAGFTPEQIAAQEAQVSQARARLADAQIAYSKTIITSPISGIVTDITVKVGEIISTNSPAIYLISEGLQIEANLPEADIAKVKLADNARVTLDAYGKTVVFEASIIKIDPAEKIIEGVATYKITLQFNKKDNRIKSGMTANIDIQTNKVENVLFVPQRAVVSRISDKIVRILDGEQVIERVVETGLRDTEGNIEIINGLKEGEQVITLIR